MKRHFQVGYAWRVALVLLCALSGGRGVSAQPARGALRNLSTRAQVDTSDDFNQILIGGLIVAGPAGATKRILARAIGPSLEGRGVSGALQDPVVAIFHGGDSVRGNNDWREAQAAEIAATHLAPESDLEAAALVTVGPGEYTVLAYGTVDTLFHPRDPRGLGVTLVEIYDLDPDSPARILNLSTRGRVGPGDNVMIAGFIVAEGTVQMIVRGNGRPLGLSSSILPGSVLEVYDAAGNLWGANDNWETGARAEIEASGLAPEDPSDPALALTLPPGEYTAILGGGGGLGMVEIYDVTP